METVHVPGDAIGPEKILFVREPSIGLHAAVVVDNTACGPAMGGVRLAPDITVEEVRRLARAMTFKNAAAGLPHGGAKAGIAGSPSWDRSTRERIVRAFAHAIRELTDYIPGPDMGLNEEAMAWIRDETGRAVGLPRVIGGIPLDEIGATGHGLTAAAEVAAPAAGIELDGARVVVQGFGAVGAHAARCLAARGARIVAAADSHGAIRDPEGLPVDALIRHKAQGHPLHTFSGGQSVTADELVGLDCEIWIPAARPDVLNETNVRAMKARLVLQGANIPATDAAEQRMHAAGILNIPDFIANAGGVICASVEYHGGTETQALAAVSGKISANTAEVLDRIKRTGQMPREAATTMARERVEAAMGLRRSW